MKSSFIRKNKNTVFKILSAAGAIIVWQAVSAAVGVDFILASPVKVLVRLAEICKEPGFLKVVLFSLLRIGAGFLSAMIMGTVFAVVAGKSKAAEYILRPYITVVKAVPVASFIIMCLMWLSFSGLTVFISFLIAFPAVYTNVLTGIKSTDKKLIETADIYKMSYGKRLRYIYIPAVKPYLISACGISAGMAWKAGVAAEVIGVVSGSVGEKLYEAKIYLQSADLFAWTVVIVAVSVAIEKLSVLLLKRIFAEVER